jgi:hypothetical protein
MDWEMGCRAPPPTPWKTLKKIRLVRLHAEPHKRELMVNREMEKRRYRFLPKSRLNHPVIGMMIALDTRYEVMTQVDSSTPAERLPAICPRETLTTDVSTISMSVGSITVMATSHLFILC